MRICDLARKYRVAASTITAIHSGRNWKRVQAAIKQAEGEV